MIDYYIKCKDKAELDSVLAECGLMDDEYYYCTASESHALVIIGEIWKPTGVFNQITDSEGNVLQIEERQKLDGYHANLRLIDIELPEILQPFTIVPQNPMYGWL